MATISFTVPAIPVAQPRQRLRSFTAGGRTFTQNYTPVRDPVNAFKATVQLAASAAYQGPPLDCPLRLTVEFVFPRHLNKCWKRRPMPRYPHTQKNDIDNLFKALADALNGLLFVDDSRIYSATITKWRAAGDEQPHCAVTIETDEEQSEAPPHRKCGKAG